MEENSEFKLYKTITLRDDPSANCLWINGTLLHLPTDHRYGESIRVNSSENLFRMNNLFFFKDFTRSTRSKNISYSVIQQ